MLPLRKARATALVIAWSVLQVALVNAQGFYYEALSGTCKDTQAFQYIGCAKTDNMFLWEPEQPNDSPTNNIPTNSYIKFSKFGHVFDTVTPHFCADTCRAHGFKYSSIQDGYQCRCGMSLTRGKMLTIDTTEADSNCAKACAGDSGDKCGNGGYANVYVDPSFPDESTLTDGAAQVAGYKKLGCFRKPAFNPNEGALSGGSSAVVNFGVPSTSKCFEQCADYGYPYAAIVRDENQGLLADK